MKEQSTKPYLIRALYQWCADSGLTPYLSARVNSRTRVPPESVKDGEIVLNISQDATRHLTLGNEFIQFSARFNGASREVSVPVDAVTGIFAKENGQGLLFQVSVEGPAASDSNAGEAQQTATSPNGGKPRLQVIK